MNFKTTLLLALILAVGIGAVVLLNKQDEKKEEAEKIAEKLLDLENENINEIILEPSGIHCVKDSNEWKIVAPVETEGDKSSIDAVANMFGWAKMERNISSDPSEYATFGLDPERGKMILIHENGSDTLFLGDKSPTGSFVFSRKSGSPDVFLTTTTLESNIQKELFDLRNKKVLGFEKSSIKSFDLQIPGGFFSINKTAGQWTLTSPGNYDADESEVDKILNRLNSENAKEFVDEDPSNLAAYGLLNPKIKIDLILGENRAKKSLSIGNVKQDRYYAKDESRKPVFLVDSAFVNVLTTTLYDLRNKDLADFSAADVDKFELNFSDQKIVCSKDTSGTWMVEQPEPRKAKSWKVSTITRKASQLEVVKFVDDHPNSLSPYGLETPQVSAAFYKGEELVLDVSLGKQVDDNVYAKTADSESVYLVEKEVLEDWTPEFDDISEVPVEPDTTKVEEQP